MATDHQQATLGIDGMHCNGCASRIAAALLELDGIESADVSLQEGAAIIAGGALPADDKLHRAVASAGDYALTEVERADPAARAESSSRRQHAIAGDRAQESLYPLFLIVGFISGVTLLVASAAGDWSIEPIMRHFMAGFFLVFSFFKLLDLPGFVSAYRGYDLVARKIPAWGWAYPFVELVLGVAYLLAWAPIVTNAVTLLLMLVGAAGVLRALLDKRTIRCACLGTALNLPMTSVTLVEDLTMAAMAAGMLTILSVG